MNAIILAAGLGRRIMPLTQHIPKALIKINGKPIIEQQIIYLRAKGIYDICIVTGYMHEKFNYLKNKFDVKLIYNSNYENYNNIYSLYLCLEFFKNTWVIEGDIVLEKNIFFKKMNSSVYYAVHKIPAQPEWELKYNDENILTEIIIHPSLNKTTKFPIPVMSGVSYWSNQNTDIIKKSILEKIDFLSKGNDNSIGLQYWDQVVLENLNRLRVKVRTIESNSITEIDTINDYRLLLAKLNKKN